MNLTLLLTEYLFYVIMIFAALFLVSFLIMHVFGEVEQQENFSNIDRDGNVYENTVEAEILDGETPIPMNDTELNAIINDMIDSMRNITTNK